MDFGLHRHQDGTNNKWTYDFTDHLMVELETIIALATMTYIAKLDAYELHPRMKKFSTNLLLKARVQHYTHSSS